MAHDHVKLPGNAEKVLEDLTKRAQEITDKALLQFKMDPDLPILYHYTNDTGLHGILGSGKMWLSDIFSLNDPSELWHGVRIGFDVLFEKMVDAGKAQKKDRAAEFEDAKKHIEKSAQFLSCSFSKTGDDLGQWRAYAADGRGYAIGFDRSKLENVSKDIGSFLVSYEENELRGVIEKICECKLTEDERGRLISSLTCNEQEYSFMKKLNGVI
ncbi:MAG: DUF2971 domain-containing protein, partial [Nitrososphaerota archaeon]|nr:DUF2971 domain-containing protein [Nitrososphaerota archaeon]